MSCWGVKKWHKKSHWWLVVAWRHIAKHWPLSLVIYISIEQYVFKQHPNINVILLMPIFDTPTRHQCNLLTKFDTPMRHQCNLQTKFDTPTWHQCNLLIKFTPQCNHNAILINIIIILLIILIIFIILLISLPTQQSSLKLTTETGCNQRWKLKNRNFAGVVQLPWVELQNFRF